MLTPRKGEKINAYLARATRAAVEGGMTQFAAAQAAFGKWTFHTQAKQPLRDHPLVLREFLGMRWAMMKTAFDTYHEIIVNGGDAEAALRVQMERYMRRFEAAPGVPMQDLGLDSGAYRMGSVGVLPVMGPIIPRSGSMARMCGIIGIDAIQQDFCKMMEDPEIKSIVMDIDSPGGNVVGVGEFAACIYEARGEKPISAYVSGSCCSAAYWLASSADQIISRPEGLVGSIGVLMSYVDKSEAEAKAGIKRGAIVSTKSPRKMLSPATEEGRAHFQQVIDDIASVMILDVAKGRGTSVQDVEENYGQGDALSADRGASKKMVDGISSFANFMSEEFGRNAKNLSGRTGSFFMDPQEAIREAARHITTVEALTATFPTLVASISATAKAGVEQTFRDLGAAAEGERVTALLAMRDDENGEQVDAAIKDRSKNAGILAQEILKASKSRDAAAVEGGKVETDATKLAAKSKGAAPASSLSADDKARADIVAAMAAGGDEYLKNNPRSAGAKIGPGRSEN